VIHEIIKRKKIDVARREQELPLVSFIDSLQPSPRNFEAALSSLETSFILECKKVSPSQGLLRTDFNVLEMAKIYAPFASCISVITDEPFFEGHLSFLTLVSEVVCCPVLCKDFVISPYQVYEARRYGADAILLMLSVLDDDMFLQCCKAANQLNMGVLTEVHNQIELQRALRLSVKIIGINNRDFESLEVDLNVSRRLIPQVPKDKIVVIESGIFTRNQVQEFQGSVDGFLVGTSLMQKKQLDLAVRELVFGRVKVCGLTSVQDAHMAYAAGASLGGLIFARESPRCIDEKSAFEITKLVVLPWVGVFANEEPERVSFLAKKLKLFAVQLHGEEDANYIKKLKTLLSAEIEIWKSVRVQSSIPPRNEFGVHRLLLDTYQANARGGTGKVFDWSLLENNPDCENLILSGGISAVNIDQAQKWNAWGVDVNSKVESRPGKKSLKKLQELFRKARGEKR
jgi:indole-3-glycerol phosphate synthase / phosphoribosylanthranilate isomerase